MLKVICRIAVGGAVLLLGAAPILGAKADDTVVEWGDTVSAREQHDVEQFWTAARMQEASRQTAARARERARAGAEVGPGAGERAGGGTAASPPDSMGGPWPRKTSRAIGKLFYQIKGRADVLGVCSASVVSSANDSVLVTAAHCLYLDEDGGAHGKYYFVPAYDHGMATFETAGWTARAAYVLPEWQGGSDLDNLQFDYGFLTLNPKDGKRIAEVTGAHRMQFEAPTPASVQTIGYPSAFPYDGESLQYCGGRPKRGREAFITSGPGTGDNLILTPCSLTQGVSGGPWVVGYDETSDLGTVVAVSTVGGFNTLAGRPLKAAAQGLYDAAQTG